MVYTPSKMEKLYGDHFAYEDGKVVGYDKRAGSKTATKYVGANGEPLAFEVVIKKLVEADKDKDTILKAKGAAGAGSRSEPGKVPVVTGGQPERGVSRIKAALYAAKVAK